ncbi:MAG: DUF2889 domain-containing protein [Proteobacteria bacterium]|nr:DUF2889 domain-containing protein [Pseudomonadota bacterium]
MMSEEAGRELVHTRVITCKAYRRQDGLWEIEGKVSDEKGQQMSFRSRPPVQPGENIHLMSLKLVIDNDYTIQAAQAESTIAPWPDCGGVDASYGKLAGLRIGPGFTKQVRQLLGGELGCAHLTDLLGELANIYVQASWPDRAARQWAVAADPRDWPDQTTLSFVGQCHAWRQDGETLRNEYPELVEGVPRPDR